MALDIPFDNSYSRLPDRFFTRQNPTPVETPALVALNRELAVELSISPDDLASPAGVAVLAGNATAKGSDPISQAYAGHQFGGWSPQLGDGRAHLLGEIVDLNGARKDIQLKGSGPTPYSRNGDGRAWLGPVLREYLVSEAMHVLDVPTTRALAAVTTGQTVRRESALPGAVLTRVASSHIRVGTFQYFAARRDLDGLRALLDYSIDRHYPAARQENDTALAFFTNVIAKQAQLVAHWMSLGFIHGVMNTDNTAISGETIDYGPCAFMDHFSPRKVFSSIDRHGRYAYMNQPDILVWNLAQLGGALLPLMSGPEDDAAELATAELRKFPEIYQFHWQSLFSKKLGLDGVRDGDVPLIEEFLTLMADTNADFTNAFVALQNNEAKAVFENSDGFHQWQSKWDARRSASFFGSKSNPAVIPRNHRIEQVIQAAVSGDFAPFEDLHRVLSNPYELAQSDQAYAQAPSGEEVVTATFCGT